MSQGFVRGDVSQTLGSGRCSLASFVKDKCPWQSIINDIWNVTIHENECYNHKTVLTSFGDEWLHLSYDQQIPKCTKIYITPSLRLYPQNFQPSLYPFHSKLLTHIWKTNLQIYNLLLKKKRHSDVILSDSNDRVIRISNLKS